MTLGTVAYAAPEQLMGEEIDVVQTSMLGATTYHLLTGAQLFPHSNPAVVISRHLNSAPPALADTRAELADLDAALTRALAKDPAERYTRCTDFARALADHGSNPNVSSSHCPQTGADTTTADPSEDRAGA